LSRRQVLKAHSDWVCALLFWGDLLVSSSLDGTLRLWNDDTPDTSWQCIRVLPSTGAAPGPDAFADVICVVAGALCTFIHNQWYAWHPQTWELIRPDTWGVERAPPDEVDLHAGGGGSSAQGAAPAPAGARLMRTIAHHASESALHSVQSSSRHTMVTYASAAPASSSSAEFSDSDHAAAVDFRSSAFVGSPLIAAQLPTGGDAETIRGSGFALPVIGGVVGGGGSGGGGGGGTVLAMLPVADADGRFNVISTGSDAMVRAWRISIVYDLPAK
jgi:hypothetical protein